MTGTVEVPPRTCVYQAGDLCVDPLRQRVLRGGVEIALPRRSFDLLLALVEVAPGMMTTAQLLDRVWPGLVVNTETVAQRVKLLRAALGDDARAPRYLQVLRGRGYRLVPPVLRVETTVAEELASPLPAPAPVDAGSSIRIRRRAWLLACGVTLCAVLLAWWWLQGQAAVDRSIAVLPFQNDAPGGDELAFGVPVAVVRELGKLKDVEVIAAASSFALADQGLDATQIGARLNARYILYGSVQRDGERLRITAQLVDAQTGFQLWSQSFDSTTSEVFAMQDEIALKVAESLELSLEATRQAQLAASRGPSSFNAYFEYLRASRLLRTERVGDLRTAQRHLWQAVNLDNDFADALVDLADVELRLAEFEPGGNRHARLAAAVEGAGVYIERALAIDPHNGRAWLQRAALRVIANDPAAADADYRRGLELLPSEASGYEGLAAVLYQNPLRHEEALAALDRARRLNPLEPRYEVTRAVFLMYGRSDLAGAEAILQRVTEQHPQYVPALVRLGEAKVLQDETPEGIRLLEDGLKLDASAELARRLLVNAYLDLDDLAAAESVLREAPGNLPVRELPLQLYRRQWRAAGETAYAALRDETVQAFDENYLALALRQHARVTGEDEDARATMEELAGVTWSEDGELEILDQIDMKTMLAALAALLVETGEEAQSQRLLQATLERISIESRRRGGMWTRHARVQALALLGDADGAIAALREQQQGRRLMMKQWLSVRLEPALDPLRQLPAFRAVVAQMDAAVREQNQRLERMRSAGVVPPRH